MVGFDGWVPGQPRVMDSGRDRQLNRWLIQLHAVEQQALFQLRRARRLADDSAMAADLDRHLRETERHRAAIAGCLRERGGRSSYLVDLAATLNRLGFLTYTALSPDRPIRLLVDSVAYEYFEIAAYGMLRLAAAEQAAAAVETTAAAILEEERAMAGRLEGSFERTIIALDRADPQAMRRRVLRHLRDVHALETQAQTLLGLGSRVAGAPALASLYREHAAETARQRERIAGRLRELGSTPTAKSAVMLIAGAAWGAIWSLQRDTAAKLACFSFSALHLEIASYEVLRREAARVGDERTAALAADLLAQEQAAAGRLEGLLGQALMRSLQRRPRPVRASA